MIDEQQERICIGFENYKCHIEKSLFEAVGLCNVRYDDGIYRHSARCPRLGSSFFIITKSQQLIIVAETCLEAVREEGAIYIQQLLCVMSLHLRRKNLFIAEQEMNPP